MRILAITNLYPRSGHETLAPFNRQQFASLAAEHELAVIAPVAWTEEVNDFRAGNIVSRSYRSPEGIEVRHPRYYFPPRIFRSSYGPFFLASIRPEVERLLSEFRPEVVIGCWAHPDGWAAVHVARNAGLPVITKVVGSDVLVATRDARRRRRVVETLRAADAVVTVSRDLAEKVCALGIDPMRIHVVYNGLDASLFCPGERVAARVRLGLDPAGPMLLFVGNLLVSKGAGVLIEAISLLARRGGDIPRCFLIGQGRDKKYLQYLIDSFELSAVVSLVGPRALEDLPHWYHACNLVVLPSYSEGIPNVLLEATACGRPFVATHVGGIPEISSSKFCRLVQPGAPAEVADAIIDVLMQGDTDPIPSMTWEASAGKLADVIRTVVASANAHAFPKSSRPPC